MCESSGTVEEVSYPQLLEAKVAAQELRRMFEKMVPIDRAIAKRTEQYRMIERLVEAVERL